MRVRAQKMACGYWPKSPHVKGLVTCFTRDTPLRDLCIMTLPDSDLNWLIGPFEQINVHKLRAYCPNMYRETLVTLVSLLSLNVG